MKFLLSRDIGRWHGKGACCTPIFNLVSPTSLTLYFKEVLELHSQQRVKNEEVVLSPATWFYVPEVAFAVGRPITGVGLGRWEGEALLVAIESTSDPCP